MHVTDSTLEMLLGWDNVGIAFAFILFNALVSGVLQIGIGNSLIISAIRCTVQLTVVATVLQQVFAAENKFIVAVISSETLLLIFSNHD
jgi:ABC-type iron transport system FetAB permease component